MAPRYRITLTESERAKLEALLRSEKIGRRKFINARALLLCNAGPHGPAWIVANVAKALGVTSRTIEHIKKRAVEDGFEAALERLWSVRKGRLLPVLLFLTASLKPV